MQGLDWKKFAFAAFAVVLLGNLANNYYDRRDRLASEQSNLAKPAASALQVLASSQSSDGAKESDFSPRLADEMAKYGVGRLTAKLEAIYIQNGVSLPRPQITGDAIVVKTQGRSFVIVRYEINAAARALEVFGISGANLNRVMCSRESIEEILITSGPCAQKILEIHGVKFGSQ